MRRFGIAKLIIHTAGSHNHEITLEGLGAEQAESLRQSLLPQSFPIPSVPMSSLPSTPMAAESNDMEPTP